MTQTTAPPEHAASFRLGSVAGTPVYLKKSWFVIAVVIAFLVGPQVYAFVPGLGTTTAYLVALGFAALLLGSVFLHEVAHAVAARAVGTPPTDIVLDLWGGHTAFAQEIRTPGRSILVAAVGPLTNGVLAVLAGLANGWTTPGSVTDVVTLLLAYSNGVVAVLNALPGLPLDGGRVLEGIVWGATGSRTTGTLVAGRIGQLVAVGVVLWFVALPYLQGRGVSLISAVWSLAIGWMLWQAASGAIRYARFRRAADGLVTSLLMRPAVAVSGTASVADARAAALSAGPPAAGGPAPLVVVLDGYGTPTGIVDEDAAATVPADRAGLVPVGSVARGMAAAVLDPTLGGEELVALLGRTADQEYPVVAGGVVVGVLDRRAVAAAISRG